MNRVRSALAAVALSAGVACGQTFLGPSPYLCQGDSPWDTSAPGFILEDFEDGFNVPGVAGNGNVTGPGGITDSVDCDDGVIDGLGRNARSYFGSGSTGITFTFSEPLPQRAGIVWTDGVHNTSANSIHFEAFARDGTRLGQIDGGHADTSQSSETAEDRFYGVEFAPGIQRFRIWQTSGCCGIEVDHLQFGPISAPCDPDLNQDGNVDQDDVSYLINVISGGGNPSGIDPDFNRDGNADQDDVAALINVIAGGPCP
jgi:hypothetical protein